MNSLCFFEIPADDLESLRGFYQEMFNWSFEKMPGKYRYYRIVTPGDSPKGGLTARQDAQHTPVNYVKVESVDEAVAKAEKLGAKVGVPKSSVPGHGWYAIFIDPQGNRIGVWEDDANA